MTAATTFCTCIEAGFLEQQVVLLARSLRALDGPHAKAALVAVQPRKGPAISGEVRRTLAGLGVDYVRADLLGGYAWANFLTKAATMAWAEREIRTPYLTWIDGDFVFARHPDALLPAAEFGLAAAPGESDLGTDGSDGNAPYWRHVAELCGVPLDSGLTLEADDNGARILEYYNSGVYTVASSEGISERQLRFFRILLERKVAARSVGFYFTDMVALAMAARGARRPRLVYGPDMNFHLQPGGYNPRHEAHVGRIKLLHYHGAFYEPTEAVHRLVGTLPEGVRDLIQAHTPFRIERMRLDRRLRRKLTGVLRDRQDRRFNGACLRI